MFNGKHLFVIKHFKNMNVSFDHYDKNMSLNFIMC